MTAAIHLGDVVPVLDAPEPTATKLGRRFGRQIDWAKIAETASEPSPAEDAPLSKRQAARSVETAHAPKWRGGTFRCPLGMRGPTFNAHCTDHVRRWIEEERRQGFDIWSGTRIQIDPGPYPATDLATGLKLGDVSPRAIRGAGARGGAPGAPGWAVRPVAADAIAAEQR
jgi:hypothetical protein